MMTVTCPSCHEINSLDDQFAGQEIACLHCGASILVSALSTVSYPVASDNAIAEDSDGRLSPSDPGMETPVPLQRIAQGKANEPGSKFHSDDQETLIDELLGNCELLRQQGKTVSAEEVCREHPELLNEVQRRLQALEPMEKWMRSDSNPTPPTQPIKQETVSIPGYQIVRELGRGGMGVVFHAKDLALDRPVALKIMRPEVAAQEDAHQRFLREARSIAALEHENIVSIHQVGESNGLPFLVMPLLSGESLHTLLRREARLPIAEVLRLGKQIAHGLAAAHATGLVHRDIKPSNIWLHTPKAAPDSSPKVKLLDFGLARSVKTDSTLTQSGMIMGTPAYMAPEQANEEPVDHRSDLFSFGCVLYQMATGRPPFTGSSTLGVLRAVVEHIPPYPREIRAELPPALSDLIMSLLAKNRDERPSTAETVALSLESISATESNTASFIADLYKQGKFQPPFDQAKTQRETSRQLQIRQSLEGSSGQRDESVSQRDLFHIEKPALPASDRDPLFLDVGFFRVRLKTVGEPTEPVFFGCASARLQLKFNGGDSRQDPKFPTLPENGRAIVEYGVGDRPSVRFEAVGQDEMLEGRARVALSLSPTEATKLKVSATLRPEWFTVKSPRQGNLDSAAKVVVDAILRKCIDISMTRRFTMSKDERDTDRP